MSSLLWPRLCLLAVLLASCGEAASGLDAGETGDSAAHDAASADDASACGVCDDGDLATADRCVGGRCEHRFCEDDRACDDADLDTTDRCVLEPASATWTCGHITADGTCGNDADCDDAVDCTRDSCGIGDRCRHAWTPGCEAPSQPSLRSCEPGAIEGGPCSFDGATGTNYDCREGSEPCADWLHCVGGTFDAHYVRVETVRPGCDAGGCPPELPAAGACSPDLYCDYSPSDPMAVAPGRIYCDCWDRSNVTIDWFCADDEPCPRTPPTDGGPVDHTWATGGTDCPYGDYVCAIDLATWTWACTETMPTFCPSSPPATGASCILASDCRYYGPESPADPVTTYRGDCTCDGAAWTCTPNEAADCPSTQPRPGSAFDICMPSTGNQHCWYPASEGLWTRCHCDGPFETNLWLCEETAHY